METEVVLYEKKEKIAVLTINRPDALNALNKDVNIALLACLEKADGDDEIRVVIITGSGNRAFIAGADIKEMLPLSSSEARVRSVVNSGHQIFYAASCFS